MKAKKFFKLAILIVLISFSSILMSCSEKKDQLEIESLQNENGYNYDEYNDNEQNSEETENNVTTKVSSENILKLSMRIPKTLNPLVNEDVTVDKILKIIFEPLFKIDETGKILPNIAESYSISNDILTIKLKSNLRWHNGTSITAKDVIFSLNTIKAQGDKTLYKSALENVSTYIENGNTITIKLTKPYYYSIRNLCIPIIPSDYYSGKTAVDSDVSMKPVGSGCFKYESYRLANSLVLEKCNGINGTPSIDKIKVLTTDNRTTDLYSFEQSITNVVQTDVNEWGKYDANKEINITEYNTNNFEFLGYNFKNSLLSNLTIRQAISQSVPASELVESVYLNHCTKSHLPINPNMWFYAKDALKEETYNLDAAKKSIIALGYTPEQLKLKILVNSENKSRCEAASIIADRLNQIGFSITVDRKPFTEYQNLLKSDNFDMFIGGVKLSNSGELKPFLSSAGITSGINYCNYSNKQLDDLLTKVETATTDDLFKASQEELQKFIEQQIPCTGICFKYSAIITDKNVNGEKTPTINNIYNDIYKWKIG